jgi:NTP pyrophosphatase (non-canonical NTP hydrolase)
MIWKILMRTKNREEYLEDFMVVANPAMNDLKLYKTCFKEEVEELLESLKKYKDDPSERENLVKEFADVQYTLSQLAVGYRVDLEEAFGRVHESNMTKLVDGKLRRREDGKILKPSTYAAPNLKGL